MGRKRRDVARGLVARQREERRKADARPERFCVCPHALGFGVRKLGFGWPLLCRLPQHRYPALLQPLQILLHPAGHGVVRVASSVSKVSIGEHAPLQDVEEQRPDRPLDGPQDDLCFCGDGWFAEDVEGVEEEHRVDDLGLERRPVLDQSPEAVESREHEEDVAASVRSVVLWGGLPRLLQYAKYAVQQSRCLGFRVCGLSQWMVFGYGSLAFLGFLQT
jgi:hypothetical protein